MTTVEIPNRPVFRAQEVCDLAEVQAYVLRTWEAEFPDLGIAKNAGGPRLYRRADVERVLRIKHLLFVDGLTMAGARRRLAEETGPVEPPPTVEADLADAMDGEARARLREVRRGLQWILTTLSGEGHTAGTAAGEFVLQAEAAGSRASAARTAELKGARASSKRPGIKKR
ncbi:MAG: MerR family transcriptional regulator [Vicinamibacterales bacterium]